MPPYLLRLFTFLNCLYYNICIYKCQYFFKKIINIFN
nr:MAG TPA: hypothetical protein [Caudoviricetes sp.]